MIKPRFVRPFRTCFSGSALDVVPVRPGPFVVLGVEDIIEVVSIFVELLSKIGISEILIGVLLSDQY